MGEVKDLISTVANICEIISFAYNTIKILCTLATRSSKKKH